MSDFLPYLNQLAEGRSLTKTDAQAAFESIMSGRADPIQIGAFIMALRVKGESVDEIGGAAEVLRAKAAKITAPAKAIDTCGTGGDGLGTYNISTTAALVAASAGAIVPKHGNRSVSSKSGSADVLMALGAHLDLPREAHEESLREFGFTFLFAPKHHQAMRHAVPTRSSLKIRTIFNLLGPLANPANTKRQLLGVFDRKWIKPMCEVLKNLGSDRVWVVSGADGLDELSISGPTYVAELHNGMIKEFELTPEEVGLDRQPIEAIIGGEAKENAAALLDVMSGAQSAYKDIVLLNAGASLVIAGQAESIADGVATARQAIDSGKAYKNMNNWIAFTQRFQEQS